ncbi:hypothetical protein GCM10008905_32810 [Clostridium malenominatum]|uniref:Uncharacterized protein n=1 Tax=Clostridium malenominatum TaxID=1539 RepID=A0ABP3UDC9_9CLOT
MLHGDDKQLKARARDMLIDGKTFDEIKKATGLRPKTVKRIQAEIAKRF